VRAADAPADPFEEDDLEVLACMLTCALHLARRLHNGGALIDLAQIQLIRDQIENARIERRRVVVDPLAPLLDE
jgi:hypothetical protein